MNDRQDLHGLLFVQASLICSCWQSLKTISRQESGRGAASVSCRFMPGKCLVQGWDGWQRRSDPLCSQVIGLIRILRLYDGVEAALSQRRPGAVHTHTTLFCGPGAFALPLHAVQISSNPDMKFCRSSWYIATALSHTGDESWTCQ